MSPRDIWREPPPDPEARRAAEEERAAKEEERAAQEARAAQERVEHPHLKAHASSAAEEAIRRLAAAHGGPTVEPAEPVEEEPEIEDYQPRHRAAGRGPIFKKPRREEAVAETVTEPEIPRQPRPSWTDEGSTVVPPQELPKDETPYLGLSRAEQRRRDKTSGRESSGPSTQPPTPSYHGRHLAPKKRWLRTSDVESVMERERHDDEDSGAIEAPGVDVAEASSELSELADSGIEMVAEAPVSQPETEAVEAAVHVEVVEATPPDGRAKAAASSVAVQEAEAVQEAVVLDTAPVAAGQEAEAEAVVADPVPQPVDVAVPEDELASVAVAEPLVVEVEPAEEIPGAPWAPSPPPPRIEVPEVLEFEGDDVDEADGFDDGLEGFDDLPEGPRKAALMKRRRRQRVVQVGGTILLSIGLIVTAVLVGAGVKEATDDDEKSAVVAGGAVVPPDEPVTTLIFGTKETSSGQPSDAMWLSLITIDPEKEQGSIVYIPAHTAAEVPGRGLQALGDAYRSGGIPLLLVSVENLLGIPIDRYLELSDNDARVLFDATGPLSVNVPHEVRVSVGKEQTRIVLTSGLQQLNPSFLVKLLYLRGEGEDDIELGSRQLAFWDALFKEIDDPDDIASAIKAAGGALGESDASAEQHARFFAGLADLEPATLTITTLPVTPASAGDSELYGTDVDELSTFLTDIVGSRSTSVGQVRVQLLNGNGVPGLGKEVAEDLIGEGFRIILSGNAQRLNYQKTLIVTYDATERGRALAERARELLGVGEVQVSQQSQGIVDLTIVVGKDYLRAH